MRLSVFPCLPVIQSLFSTTEFRSWHCTQKWASDRNLSSTIALLATLNWVLRNICSQKGCFGSKSGCPYIFCSLLLPRLQVLSWIKPWKTLTDLTNRRLDFRHPEVFLWFYSEDMIVILSLKMVPPKQIKNSPHSSEQSYSDFIEHWHELWVFGLCKDTKWCSCKM